MGRTASLSWFTPPPDLTAPSLAEQLEPFTASTRKEPSATSTGNYVGVFKVVLTILALAALATWAGPRAAAGYRIPPSANCNPFAEPGSLFLNIENTTSTYWKPFDQTCPPSHLLPLVDFVLESDTIEPASALPWMVNRTVVLIGDSIERFSLDYFCSLMDGELSLIDLSHPFSPPPFRNGRDDLREDTETVNTWIADGRPHWCRINHGGLNLNLLSFFMYGSANYAEFEQQGAVFGRPHYYAPAQLSDRVDHWVLGTLERAGLKADIVQFSSCLWDVMHWSEVDSAAALSQDVVHAPFPSSERLNWYQDRLTASLDKIEQTFPQSTLVWRRGHDVSCGQFHVPCARNTQFNGVADHAIKQRQDRWAVDETGSMIRGHSDFYKDKVHPGEVFRGLWADVLLHRLRESHLAGRPVRGRFTQRQKL